MMNSCTKEEWLASLKNGDIGLLHSHNFFAWLQNLRRQKFGEGDLQANHGFYVYTPPDIMESNGIFVSQGHIIKNIDDKTETYVFRFRGITPEQVRIMNVWWESQVNGGAHYGIGQIAQFALQQFGVRKHLTDASGMFCTEDTGKGLIEAQVPYISTVHPDIPSYDVDPSMQLNWFMSDEATRLGWFLAAHYDGNSGYFKY
jgi:hypothetical protein